MPGIQFSVILGMVKTSTFTPTKVSEDNKSPLKSPCNNKSKKGSQEHKASAALSPDGKASSEKIILKISKKSITSLGDSAPEADDSTLEQEQKTGTGECITSPRSQKQQSSCGSQNERDIGTGDESQDSITESLINALAKAGDSLSGAETKSIISRLTSKLKPKIKKKKKRKNSRYESVQFGNNWTRKIKWKGERRRGGGLAAQPRRPDDQVPYRTSGLFQEGR